MCSLFLISNMTHSMFIKHTSALKQSLLCACMIAGALTNTGCVTPMYYSDKLSVPLITDSTRTSVEFNSGVELFTRSKWVMKFEATRQVVGPVLISGNLKLVKAFHRDPVFVSGGISGGFFFDSFTGRSGDTSSAQLQCLFGYDQGRNIGTFRNPPVFGERTPDNRLFDIDIESEPTISIFSIRRFLQGNLFIPLNRLSHLAFSYRVSWFSNSRFSIPYDRNIYDEPTIYSDGATAMLFEPTVTYITSGHDGVSFLIQVGKVFTRGEESFAVSPLFLVYGVQYGF